VLLDGGSGNFGFSAGGPRWLFELMVRGRFRTMWTEAEMWAAAREMPVRQVLKRSLINEGFPRLTHLHHRRKQRDRISANLRASAVSIDRLQQVDNDQLNVQWARPYSKGYTRDTANLYQFLAAQSEYHVAVRGRWGVDVRDPLSDRRVLESALRQPEWYRNHRGVWRAIARDAMKDDLPASIVNRNELGAQLPEWFEVLTALRPVIEKDLEAMCDHPASREVFNIDRLMSLYANWPAPDRKLKFGERLDYRLALPRSLAISRYMQWFEARASRVRSGGPAVVLSDPYDVTPDG
jgi:hypothetical protein